MTFEDEEKFEELRQEMRILESKFFYLKSVLATYEVHYIDKTLKRMEQLEKTYKGDDSITWYLRWDALKNTLDLGD